jgi:hypothetical protein
MIITIDYGGNPSKTFSEARYCTKSVNRALTVLTNILTEENSDDG